MNEALIQSPEGTLAALVGVAAFFFYLEKRTQWKLFEYLPPLLFIYATPLVLTNVGLTSDVSPVYTVLKDFGLPVFLCLMLISIDLGAAVRIMGRGVLVMLMGTVGVVVGGIVSYALVKDWLAPDAWKGFGTLAASWIGGTGNMGAVADGLNTPKEQFGLAVLADTAVYVVWLPILLGSRNFAEKFNRWARVDPKRIERMDAAAAAHSTHEERPMMRDYLNLGVLAVSVTWIATLLAPMLPTYGEAFSVSTWKVLLITTMSIGLSFTKAKHIPGSHQVAMAIIYVFVAGMGARASLSGLAQAPVFLAAAFLWILIHGAFCLLGARLLHVDIHSVAIASAANVGGAASAPIVAAAHRASLVPVSVLMALLGYALGNYAATGMASVCEIIAGG